MARRYNSFTKFVKNFDIFGHPVALNFDKKGSKHQTFCGGCTSYLWFIFIVVTVIIQFVVMCTNSQALYYSHEFPLNITAKGGFDAFIENSDDVTNADNEGGLGIYMYLLDTTNDMAVNYDTAN